MLSRLKPEELSQCFVNWTEALCESLGGDIVAIDGKTLRRSFALPLSVKQSRCEVPFIDPDPFHELTYPTAIAAKLAIADELVMPPREAPARGDDCP